MAVRGLAMARKIEKVAVLGGGTMGAGIAGLCAEKGLPVLLLEIDAAAAEAALERIVSGRPPAIDTPGAEKNITTGTFDDDLEKLADCDWICEVVVENLGIKRKLLARVEAARGEGSIVTTNTSGIRLSSIAEGMPERLRRDIAVTHFFNPVKVMRLLELVPGPDTDPDVIPTLADFARDVLGKGPVFAKDTVNFIGNRIGCFWILAGLHLGGDVRKAGRLDIETIDAVMSSPVGVPATGLYGLVDLIGLDVMDLVAKNMATNLPSGDRGHAFASLPEAEAKMLAAGQLGRKSGGGFYRLVKADDGSRSKEVFEPETGTWRPAREVELAGELRRADTLFFAEGPEAEFANDVMLRTLIYAAGLVPEIADDIVNIDRAMRWGFGWRMGPFQLLDAIGPEKIVARLEKEGRELPKMLAVLNAAGAPSFYRGDEFLGVDGAWHAVPAE